ncbi:hypothetical protein NSMM_330013 [Nitrosomonas mobilis]|jgi:hypothetical protein|uniref:Uncharacterized protein n=1 Tax=Nitrosomonas mobilis TaxID=51642 RepID=A0A1G5SCT3_9PROT|nr:hypothetical protein NSMM_330013 [Nitrosomonas mobilis]
MTEIWLIHGYLVHVVLKKLIAHGKIIHEHISFPVDCMENIIVFETLEEA